MNRLTVKHNSMSDILSSAHDDTKPASHIITRHYEGISVNRFIRLSHRVNNKQLGEIQQTSTARKYKSQRNAHDLFSLNTSLGEMYGRGSVTSFRVIFHQN